MKTWRKFQCRLLDDRRLSTHCIHASIPVVQHREKIMYYSCQSIMQIQSRCSRPTPRSRGTAMPQSISAARRPIVRYHLRPTTHHTDESARVFLVRLKTHLFLGVLEFLEHPHSIWLQFLVIPLVLVLGFTPLVHFSRAGMEYRLESRCSMTRQQTGAFRQPRRHARRSRLAR